MSKQRLAVLITALVAVLCGARLASRSSEVSMPAATKNADGNQAALADYQFRLGELDRGLDRERAQRAALAAEVAELRRELASITERVGVEIASATAGHEQEEASNESSKAGDQPPKDRPRGLDADALVAAGFPADTVRSFKERVDQIELDHLYLRDLAAREGWLDTPRFREEAGDFSLSMRETRKEFGDEFYDWMLFTTGHPNRVRVGNVIDGSAAAEAGLLPGDVVLTYDDQRIFSPRELSDATTTGEAGESTAVGVLRDGRETRIYVPRGPLGIRLEYANEQPPPKS